MNCKTVKEYEEKCDLCGEFFADYDYVLVDGSKIRICSQCGKVLYNVDLTPIVNSRLLHIAALTDFVDWFYNGD